MGDSAVKITQNKELTLAVVSGAMTIGRIAEIREGILHAFESGKGVQLSLARVTEIDLTGLQLLCSSHRTSMARNQKLQLVGADSGVISSVARMAGMLRHTGCAQDICGTCFWNNNLF